MSVELGDEAAAHIEQYLQNCSALLTKVLEVFEHRPGVISTRVPASLSSGEVDLTRFRESILMYLDEIRGPDLIDDLVSVISRHLEKESHVCLMQETLTVDGGSVSPLEPELAYLHCGRERYFLLTHRDAGDLPRIVHAVESAMFTIWQFGGVLTRMPQDRLSNSSGQLSPQDIENLAAEASALFVGAYDGEGYVI